MPFQIIRNDITRVECDAIVNPTDNCLSCSGSTDGAIHRVAGPELEKECKNIGQCNPGEAVLTKGYNLPAKYVIHTVGPVWNDGKGGEDAILRSCYTECLNIAVDNKCDSIAFPLISAGTYGFPKDRALEIARKIISNFLQSHDMMVYLVVYDKKVFELSKNISDDIKEYIDQNYVDECFYGELSNLREFALCDGIDGLEDDHFDLEANYKEELIFPELLKPEPRICHKEEVVPKSRAKKSKADFIIELDKSFADTLFELIDKSGMSDPECYKKANIDKRLFSKIKSDSNYRPKKETAIAFAVALELNVEETNNLIGKAGYVLSQSSLFDVIIKYHIENKIYNIFAINEALFEYDQKTLGSI